MQIFLFQSEIDNDLAGFTEEEDGGNLPSDYAPWKLIGGRAVQIGSNLSGVSGGGDALLAAIQRDGFFLARSETIH
jgi:hypothetical protein